MDEKRHHRRARLSDGLHSGFSDPIRMSDSRLLVLVAVLSMVAACEETDDFRNECVVDRIPLYGAWEGSERPFAGDIPGVWWRFELNEQPQSPGRITLDGLYVTDYLYHLDGFQEPDTLSGGIQGGLICLTLGRGSPLSEDLNLRFHLEYPDGQGTEDCTFDAYIGRNGREPHVNGSLVCTNDIRRRETMLEIKRVESSPSGARFGQR